MVERCLSFRVRRFLILALVAMLAFVPICQAYGDDYEGGGGTSTSFNNSFGTVWYGPTGSGGSANILYVRYGVVANTKYDAALYCCKGRNFDLSDVSNKKKSKLLKNGDFKQFADLFNVGKPELTDDWGGDASIVQAWNSARQLYGETYCYNARYTNDQKIRAQEAIEDILNDDDTPSGGGSGGSGGNVSHGTIPKQFTLNYVGNYDDVYGSTVNVKFTDEMYDVWSPYIEENDPGYTTWFCSLEYESKQLWLWTFHNPVPYLEFVDGKVKYLKSDEQITYMVWGYSGEGLGYAYDESTNTLVINSRKGVGFSHTLQSQLNVSNIRYCYGLNSVSGGGSGGGDGGGGDDPEPPIEWPNPPTEKPKPPDVPTPGDPVGPNPWIPIPDDDIDITGDNFQDLLDALNEHCIHLQNSIESNVSQLWDLESDFLGSAFEDLKSYLHELFEWLSEQLNFDVTVEGGQYDDTSVLYWLKQIWSKLPTGINTRPTDPVTDPNGWWDWLTQLLNNLAADLMALGHDKLAGVLETLNELRNKFPFSLPWDVAALLGLLVGVPECPEFDMPCYTVSLEGLQQVGTYHITLEPYEQVWEGVKWIETLAFAVYLIMNTGGLMDMVAKTVRPR